MKRRNFLTKFLVRVSLLNQFTLHINIYFAYTSNRAYFIGLTQYSGVIPHLFWRILIVEKEFIQLNQIISRKKKSKILNALKRMQPNFVSELVTKLSKYILSEKKQVRKFNIVATAVLCCAYSSTIHVKIDKNIIFIEFYINCRHDQSNMTSLAKSLDLKSEQVWQTT